MSIKGRKEEDSAVMAMTTEADCDVIEEVQDEGGIDGDYAIEKLIADSGCSRTSR